MKVKYIHSFAKILEGLVWLATEKPGLDHYHVVKTFFLADKLHLNRYGRPIFGDMYVAMDYGPVPSFTLDLINCNAFVVPREQIAEVKAAISIEENEQKKLLRARRSPRTEAFSGTDLRCLADALETVSPMSFGELVDMTHSEQAWSQAWEEKSPGQRSALMDFELLIDQDNRYRDEIIQRIRETHCNLVL